MKRLIVKGCTIGLMIGFLCYASQAIAANYIFTQDGFSGGGKIRINFSGEDKNGGINGLNGNLQNPDGKIGFFDCKGSRPACETYHVDKFDKEMSLNFTLTGSTLFQKAQVALSKLQQQDFDVVGFFDRDNNNFSLEVNLGYYGAPLYELKITNNKSTVCEYTYDSTFNSTKQCESSAQTGLIAGPPAYIAWTPGSAASIQPPPTLSLTVKGLTAEISTPAATHETGGGWIQVPLTGPAVTPGTILKLDSIALIYTAPLKSVGGTGVDAYYERAIINQIDVFDGNQKLFSKTIVPWPNKSNLSRNKDKDIFGLGSNMREMISLPPNTRLTGGLSVSLHIVNQCVINAVCTAQKIILNKIAAGFNP